MRALNLLGKRFGRLTVIGFVGTNRENQKRYWACRCDCGGLTDVHTNLLTNRHVQSCGCLHIEHAVSLKYSHGGAGSRLYMRWNQFMRRCEDSGHKRFQDYGGRGIKVCAGYRQFAFFKAKLGEPPHDQILDREDNNAHYSCGECYECLENGWASNVHYVTRTRSARNCRSNAMIEYRGTLYCMADLAPVVGLPYSTLQSRRTRGVTGDAFFAPKKR